MRSPIEVAVVGCGHMGAHHARVIAEHPECRLVAAVDILQGPSQRLARHHGCEARATVPDGVHAVVVSTPTTTHAEVAAPIIEGGAWCLVEKPLAASRLEAMGLMGKRVAVGHSERFNPALRAAGALRPRHVEARRMGRPRGRCLDVDVVADLMVHDIDLVLHWSDSEVEWLDAQGAPANGRGADWAVVKLRMRDGMTASLRASRVAQADERAVRVYQRGSYASLDMLRGIALDGRGPLDLPGGGDALTAQWCAFVHAVRGRAPLVVGADQALRGLELVERIGAALGHAH